MRHAQSGVCTAQGLVKFDQSLVNAKESSVAPSFSADVEPAASEDMHHFESTLASLPHTGDKVQHHQQQHPAQRKLSEPTKRPKKRLKKGEDSSHNANWDSDQSSQVLASLRPSSTVSSRFSQEHCHMQRAS